MAKIKITNGNDEYIVPDLTEAGTIAGEAVPAGLTSGYVRTGLKDGTTAGNYSTIEGQNNEASKVGTHAGGSGSKATGNYAFAHGSGVTASGICSAAIGLNNTASSRGSVALGLGTTAKNEGELAVGKYNKTGDYLFSVGNGTSLVPANAMSVDTNGNAVFSGTVNGVKIENTEVKVLTALPSTGVEGQMVLVGLADSYSAHAGNSSGGNTDFVVDVLESTDNLYEWYSQNYEWTDSHVAYIPSSNCVAILKDSYDVSSGEPPYYQITTYDLGQSYQYRFYQVSDEVNYASDIITIVFHQYSKDLYMYIGGQWTKVIQDIPEDDAGITSISVNGTEVTATDGAVDLTIPTDVGITSISVNDEPVDAVDGAVNLEIGIEEAAAFPENPKRGDTVIVKSDDTYAATTEILGTVLVFLYSSDTELESHITKLVNKNKEQYEIEYNPTTGDVYAFVTLPSKYSSLANRTSANYSYYFASASDTTLQAVSGITHVVFVDYSEYINIKPVDFESDALYIVKITGKKYAYIYLNDKWTMLSDEVPEGLRTGNILTGLAENCPIPAHDDCSALGGGNIISLHSSCSVATGGGNEIDDTWYGFTAGMNNYVSGEASSTLGAGLAATGNRQTVVGTGNLPDDNSEYAFIVGNGDWANNYNKLAGNSGRSNALTVDWSGNLEVAGKYNSAVIKDGYWTTGISSDSTIQTENNVFAPVGTTSITSGLYNFVASDAVPRIDEENDDVSPLTIEGSYNTLFTSGKNNTITGNYNFTKGYRLTVDGNSNILFGRRDRVSGNDNFIMSMNSTYMNYNDIHGEFNTVFGSDNILGSDEHGGAVGWNFIAYGEGNTILGSGNFISGGFNEIASDAYNNICMGSFNEISGRDNYIFGNCIKVSSDQIIMGSWNEEDPDKLFILAAGDEYRKDESGNIITDNNGDWIEFRENVLTVDRSGNLQTAGTVNGVNLTTLSEDVDSVKVDVVNTLPDTGEDGKMVLLGDPSYTVANKNGVESTHVKSCSSTATNADLESLYNDGFVFCIAGDIMYELSEADDTFTATQVTFASVDAMPDNPVQDTVYIYDVTPPRTPYIRINSAWKKLVTEDTAIKIKWNGEIVEPDSEGFYCLNAE